MELRQAEFFRGSRIVRLDESDTITVQAKNGRVFNEYPVYLNVLHDVPTRVHRTARAGGVAVIGTAIVFLLFLFCMLFAPQIEAKVSFAPMCVIFGFITMAGYAGMRQVSYNLLVFYNRFNGQAAFNLYRDRPDPKSFATFVSVLKQRIKQAHAKIPPVPQEMSIPTQIEMYARLAKDGVITEAQFEELKKNLLETLTGSGKQIGFQHQPS
jgi:hypothetical protein